MPKPPPPPPGPPPPPAFPAGIVSASAASKKNGGPDKRNQLLADIRQGAHLKKTVTNDRSAPAIEGASKSTGGKPSVANGGPPGLAGLFAGGMPALKPSGFNQRPQALKPQAKKNFHDDSYKPSGKPQFGSQSSPSSPQPTSKSGIPAGYGTMRGFPKDLKGHAPQPPPASQKPLASSSIGPGDNGRPRAGPPLPNKPPNVPQSRPTLAPAVPRAPPSNKPPPPPKSPAVMPPALPSKPPNRPRPQSVNESDYRVNGKPVVIRNTNQASPTKERPPSIPIHEDQLNRMKNASTPNLLQLQNHSGVTKPLPPPPPPRADQAFPQFNSLPFKLNPNGLPMQTRPGHVKAPATRPPPPPPTGPPRVMANQPTVPPPPPPHRSNQPIQPPPPQFKPGFNNAPPPPPRNSSTKNPNGDDLDCRFYSMFLSINSLPAPEPFTNCTKSYPSRLHHGSSKREQAPPVPPNNFRGNYPMPDTQLQIGSKMFANSSSEC